MKRRERDREGEREIRDYISRFEREFDPLLGIGGSSIGLALGYREYIYAV